ncbi:MAG TPA: 2,3-bisphosphoglycerate-independent phosphoglycerate mutase [Gemmatimonadales bacterium]|nr:2,3-bisphosphoglycerate-independent phosphoglycerate mutase [Gemmatimonadales bacterium]
MSKVTRAKGPVVLIVLDGWGYRAEREGNAIAMAKVPTWDRLWARQPKTLLEASGLPVGLPAGQMGNSEVGHLNLGAGRVVPQDLVRISQSIDSGAFFQLPPLLALADHVRRSGGTLHLMGLLGDGGVHAIDTHLLGCLDFAERQELPRIAVHGFLDGRDTLPTSAAGYVRTLLQEMKARTGGRAVLSTLTGRYYAMDRDKRWERTKLAYDALTRGAGQLVDDPVKAVEDCYARGETDEFIKPLVIRTRDGAVPPLLRDGDAVFFFNYRADRMRQIGHALCTPGFSGFDVTGGPKLAAATMTQYDATLLLPAAFPPFSMANIVGEWLSKQGRTQFRTAETEKYPHVSYFFNGGVETPFAGEERQLVPSQKVATYDLAPEMSAAGITDTLCGAIARKQHDFLLCNYANADMVGHTGVQSAILTAVETIDKSLTRVLAAAEKAGATVLITADHGNCEMMIDPVSGGPHTAHTTNPVPFVLIGDGTPNFRAGGALCDVGPTILGLLGLEQPPEMTGRDLRLP